MGGEWSKEIRPRLEDFLKTLAKIADHYVHSIILLGDIFEMWMTPITVTPPTLKEFVKHWRSDDVSRVSSLQAGTFFSYFLSQGPRSLKPLDSPSKASASLKVWSRVLK